MFHGGAINGKISQLPTAPRRGSRTRQGALAPHTMFGSCRRARPAIVHVADLTHPDARALGRVPITSLPRITVAPRGGDPECRVRDRCRGRTPFRGSSSPRDIHRARSSVQISRRLRRQSSARGPSRARRDPPRTAMGSDSRGARRDRGGSGRGDSAVAVFNYFQGLLERRARQRRHARALAFDTHARRARREPRRHSFRTRGPAPVAAAGV